MSRLDRLVRRVGASMEDAEVLVASVLGRRSDGRGHAALVATDRRLLLVTEGFTRTMLDELDYEEVTLFDRLDDGDLGVVEVVADEARWRLERIELDPSSRAALDLVARRCRGGRPLTPTPPRVRLTAPAAAGGPPPGV